jgi:hypothetical protein
MTTEISLIVMLNYPAVEEGHGMPSRRKRKQTGMRAFAISVYSGS